VTALPEPCQHPALTERTTMPNAIEYIDDIPAELRPLFIQTVKAAQHVQEGDIKQLYAKLRTAKAVLADRERELLDLKGPCTSDWCRLHHAHSGPCDRHSILDEDAP
jgi:hypothetical protein